MKSHEAVAYRFGEFTLVPGERRLVGANGPLALTGKAFDLLAVLVRNAGHLVTKDELLQQVWPGLVVEEVNLSVNVSVIRKTLGGRAAGNDWIETVARQGYRFGSEVRILDIATVEPAALSDAAAPAPAAGQRSRWWAATGAVVLTLLAALVVSQAVRNEPPLRSVAVLPFEIARPDDAYLADGLVEDVIASLARRPGLQVAARASVFQLRGADAQVAARRLGTAALVSGRLVRENTAITLRVELLDVARGTVRWRGNYAGGVSDLSQWRGRMTSDIEQALRLPPDASVAARPKPPSPEAYQAYLQGRYLWNRRSRDALQRSITSFTRAIELDPGFALAHAALADAHTTLGYLGHVSPVEAFPVARPHALKALELDPTLASAHAALAYIKFYFDWDWSGAREEFRRALALDPKDPVSHQWYAVYLVASGAAGEAFAQVQQAHRLDPLSLAINTDIGFHHYYAGRMNEAIAQLNTVLAMNADFALARLWLARSHLALGRLDEALAETARLEGGARDWPVLMAHRGFALGAAGRRDEARAMLRRMDELSARQFVTTYGKALVHAGLGDKDRAFAALEGAFAERSHWLVWLRLDPRWNSLRGDARFQSMVERMRYPG